MLMRYLKCQLMVLVFGGIVGPIFLAIGLAGVPVVGTMFLWMGLFITVIDVVVRSSGRIMEPSRPPRHKPSKPLACSGWVASWAWGRREPGSTTCPW